MLPGKLVAVKFLARKLLPCNARVMAG